jgi:hypothetical protein
MAKVLRSSGRSLDEGTRAMIELLPHLSDEQKRALCLRMEAWGLLRHTPQGRLVLTTEGHLTGCMLYAMAALEQAEREIAERAKQETPPLQ